MPCADEVVAPIEDSALALDRRGIAQGASATIGDPESDTLVYVTDGNGSISLGGEVGPLAVRNAALVLAGEEATIGADEALDLVVLSVGVEADRHAPLGRRVLTASLDAADGQQATGARSFQILFDATNGSTRATLFAGYVPPGKAPWHGGSASCRNSPPCRTAGTYAGASTPTRSSRTPRTAAVAREAG